MRKGSTRPQGVRQEGLEDRDPEAALGQDRPDPLGAEDVFSPQSHQQVVGGSGSQVHMCRGRWVTAHKSACAVGSSTYSRPSSLTPLSTSHLTEHIPISCSNPLPHSPSLARSPCLLGIQVTCTSLPYLSNLLFPLTTPTSSFSAH